MSNSTQDHDRDEYIRDSRDGKRPSEIVEEKLRRLLPHYVPLSALSRFPKPNQSDRDRQ